MTDRMADTGDGEPMPDNSPGETTQECVRRIERTYPEADVETYYDEEMESWRIDVYKDMTCISDHRTTEDIVRKIVRDEEKKEGMIYASISAA